MLASFIPGCDSTPELKSSPAQPLLAASHTVIGTQATRQHDVAQILALQQAPVKALAATAPAVVEQVLVDMAERTGREGFTNAQRFPDTDVVREGVAQRVDIGLVLITVQLHGGQPQSLRAGDHLVQRRIAKHADVLQRRCGDHRFGLGVIHRPRRSRDENQATVDGAGLPGHLGILRARQAAHFILAEQHAFNRRFQIRLLHQGRSRSGSRWRSGSARALQHRYGCRIR